MSIYNLKYPSPALCALPAVPGRDASVFLASSSSAAAGSQLITVAIDEEGRVEGRDYALQGAAAGASGTAAPRDEIVQLEYGGVDSNAWLAWATAGTRATGYVARLLRLPFAGTGAEVVAELPGAPACLLGVQPGDRPETVYLASTTTTNITVSVYSSANAGPVLSSSFNIPPGRDPPSSIACNPHSTHLFSVTTDSFVHLFDSRIGGGSNALQPTLSISAHSHVTAQSYNPNVPHLVATGGKDGKARIWDMRNGEGVKEVWGGGHWVTSLEYHPTHDQLLLTASSDGQVLLHDIGSVSYAGVADSDSSEVESDEGEDREPRRPRADALIATYDHFGDSVYRVAWAHGSPWAFAGCAWGNPGGRVGCGEVPRAAKMGIMLGE